MWRLMYTNVKILKKLLIFKEKREIYVRHVLATEARENLYQYLQALHFLTKNCKFKDVFTHIYKEESLAFFLGYPHFLFDRGILKTKR